MRIMRVSDSMQPPQLVEADVPRPQPRRGELLVRVYAAGVTSTELLWYPELEPDPLAGVASVLFEPALSKVLGSSLTKRRVWARSHPILMGRNCSTPREGSVRVFGGV